MRREAAFASADAKTVLKARGSVKESVARATEQRVLSLIHSVSNLVMVAARSDLEVTRRLRSAVNYEWKEVVFSLANLSWRAVQILDGVWLAVMMGSPWKLTISRKKIDAHRYNER